MQRLGYRQKFSFFLNFFAIFIYYIYESLSEKVNIIGSHLPECLTTTMMQVVTSSEPNILTLSVTNENNYFQNPGLFQLKVTSNIKYQLGSVVHSVSIKLMSSIFAQQIHRHYLYCWYSMIQKSVEFRGIRLVEQRSNKES